MKNNGAVHSACFPLVHFLDLPICIFHFAFFILHSSQTVMPPTACPSHQTNSVPESSPAAAPRRHRWLLAAAIILEAAWIALLAVLAVMR